METYALKLTAHYFCADVNAKVGLELCCHKVCRSLVTLMYYAPQHSVTLLCDFMWSVISWMS